MNNEQETEDAIEDLFEDGNAVSTGDVARWKCITENEARAWADEIGVAKVGASFAWTRDDVQDLLDRLDAEVDAEGACEESAAECSANEDDDEDDLDDDLDDEDAADGDD